MGYEMENNENNNKEKLVMVSGCFDPFHLGHLLSFQAAKKLGDKLIVIINGDDFLIKKKGGVFLPLEDRVAIIKELKCVDEVIVIGNEDQSDAILYIKPDIFANGGDRNSWRNIPLLMREACEKVGCKLVFNVGGGKIRGSSELLKKWCDSEKEREENINKYREDMKPYGTKF